MSIGTYFSERAFTFAFGSFYESTNLTGVLKKIERAVNLDALEGYMVFDIWGDTLYNAS